MWQSQGQVDPFLRRHNCNDECVKYPTRVLLNQIFPFRSFELFRSPETINSYIEDQRYKRCDTESSSYGPLSFLKRSHLILDDAFDFWNGQSSFKILLWLFRLFESSIHWVLINRGVESLAADKFSSRREIRENCGNGRNERYKAEKKSKRRRRTSK